MELVAPAGPMYQAGTLSGNPLAMTAGIQTLKRLKEPGSYEYLDKITGELIQGILDAGKRLGMPYVVGILVGCLGFSSQRDLFTTLGMQRIVIQQNLQGFLGECWRKVFTLHLPSLRLGLLAWHIHLKISNKR